MNLKKIAAISLVCYLAQSDSQVHALAQKEAMTASALLEKKHKKHHHKSRRPKHHENVGIIQKDEDSDQKATIKMVKEELESELNQSEREMENEEMHEGYDKAVEAESETLASATEAKVDESVGMKSAEKLLNNMKAQEEDQTNFEEEAQKRVHAQMEQAAERITHSSSDIHDLETTIGKAEEDSPVQTESTANLIAKAILHQKMKAAGVAETTEETTEPEPVLSKQEPVSVVQSSNLNFDQIRKTNEILKGIKKRTPILTGPSPPEAPVSYTPVHAQTSTNDEAEVEAMLDVERKQEVAQAKAEGRSPDESKFKSMSEVKVESDIINKLKKESDEEIFADDVEIRQHKAQIRSSQASEEKPESKPVEPQQPVQSLAESSASSQQENAVKHTLELIKKRQAEKSLDEQIPTSFESRVAAMPDSVQRLNELDKKIKELQEKTKQSKPQESQVKPKSSMPQIEVSTLTAPETPAPKVEAPVAKVQSVSKSKLDDDDDLSAYTVDVDTPPKTLTQKKEQSTSFSIETSKLEDDDSYITKPTQPVAPPTVVAQKPITVPELPKLQQKVSAESNSFKIETSTIEADDSDFMPKTVSKPVEKKPEPVKKVEPAPKVVVPKKEEDNHFQIETTVATTELLKNLVGDKTNEEEELKKMLSEAEKPKPIVEKPKQSLATVSADAAEGETQSQSGMSIQSVFEEALGGGINGERNATLEAELKSMVQVLNPELRQRFEKLNEDVEIKILVKEHDYPKDTFNEVMNLDWEFEAPPQEEVKPAPVQTVAQNDYHSAVQASLQKAQQLSVSEKTTEQMIQEARQSIKEKLTQKVQQSQAPLDPAANSTTMSIIQRTIALAKERQEHPLSGSLFDIQTQQDIRTHNETVPVAKPKIPEVPPPNNVRNISPVALPAKTNVNITPVATQAQVKNSTIPTVPTATLAVAKQIPTQPAATNNTFLAAATVAAKPTQIAAKK